LYLSLERLLTRFLKFRLPAAVHWFITFQLVCFAWIFFRAEDFATSKAIIVKIAQLPAEPVLAGVEGYQAVLLSMLLVLHWAGERWHIRERLFFAKPVAWGLTAACMLVSLLIWSPSESAPFIYFQF